MTVSKVRNSPDLDKLVRVARRFATALEVDRTYSDDDFRAELKDILYGSRAMWNALRSRVITPEEAAMGILANLDSRMDINRKRTWADLDVDVQRLLTSTALESLMSDG